MQINIIDGNSGRTSSVHDPQDSWKGEIEVWEKKSTKQLKIQAS